MRKLFKSNVKTIIFLLLFGVSINSYAVSINQAWANCLSYATAYGPSQTGCKAKAGNTATTGGFVTNPGGYYTGGGFLYTTGCTSPYVWTQSNSTTGACVAPLVACPAGQYDNNGTCNAIPDCNASTSIGGNFFNLTTKQCETSTAPMTICISGDSSGANSGSNFYCPPIDDCKPSGYICTNSPTAISAATQARQLAQDAAKTAANENKTKAAAAATQATQAAAAHGANLPAAIHAADAAKTALDNKTADPTATADEIKLAQAVYNQAVKDVNTIKAKSANANAAAMSSGNGATAAKIAADSIVPGTGTGNTNPGNAGALQGQSLNGLADALNGLNDAITGLGTGQGEAQGTSVANCLLTNSCGNGGGSFKGAASPGGLNGGFTDGYAKGVSLLCSGNCAQGPTCATGQCSSSERLNQLKNSLIPSGAFSSGSCPTAVIDLSVMNLGSHVFDSHCQLLELTRSLIATVMQFVAALTFIFIVLEA